MPSQTSIAVAAAAAAMAVAPAAGVVMQRQETDSDAHPWTPSLEWKSECEDCAPAPTKPPWDLVRPNTTKLALEHVYDPCRCMSWKKTYITNHVFCGDGLEGEGFSELTGGKNGKKAAIPMDKVGKAKHEAAELKHNQYCNAAYMEIDDPICVNAHMGEKPGQWCYVDHKCQKLNGGWRVVGWDKTWKMAVKMCTSGSDKLLSEKNVFDLEDYAAAHQIEMPLLVKLAYPTMPGLTWQNVSDFYAGRKSELSEEHINTLKDLVNTSKPVVWSAESDKVPFGVAWGMMAWEVGADATGSALNLNMKKLKKNQDRPKPTWECVYGCST